jgi:hypothetical protein
MFRYGRDVEEPVNCIAARTAFSPRLPNPNRLARRLLPPGRLASFGARGFAVSFRMSAPCVLCVAGLVASWGAPAALAQTARPNIVLVMADDLGDETLG